LTVDRIPFPSTLLAGMKSAKNLSGKRGKTNLPLMKYSSLGKKGASAEKLTSSVGEGKSAESGPRCNKPVMLLLKIVVLIIVIVGILHESMIFNESLEATGDYNYFVKQQTTR
jgi:hypothetical protein